MHLYGSYFSPFVRHCRVALAQEKVDFTFVDTDYATSAAESPTGKVPYLSDGELRLTDSSSIVKYVRETAGHAFLAEIDDYEMFVMTGTLVDAVINVFLLEKDGIGPEQASYIGRQNDRVKSGLIELNQRFDPAEGIARDSALRCACFIDWALFRQRISIAGHDNLRALLDAANQVEAFKQTSPALAPV